MERKREPYPVSTLCELKDNIDTNPDYQRPAVWKTSNKQLLIDTILRGLDVPKFYWKQIDEDHFEVIDGQQRIRTIWELLLIFLMKWCFKQSNRRLDSCLIFIIT